jgi:hypothetical protein
MKKWQRNRRWLGPWLKLEGRFLIIIFQRKPFNHIDVKVTLELNGDISIFQSFHHHLLAGKGCRQLAKSAESPDGVSQRKNRIELLSGFYTDTETDTDTDTGIDARYFLLRIDQHFPKDVRDD